MGISRDSYHKRRSTGGKRKAIRKKRKFELGRPAANTKIGVHRVHSVRTRGGNIKRRGLRLDTGNFAWASEGKLTTPIMIVEPIDTTVLRFRLFDKNNTKRKMQESCRLPIDSTGGAARKTRIIDVVYNASNNELVRTKTLVKNAIVVIDGTPFRQWYESHYILPLGRKRDAKLTNEENDILTKKRSAKVMKKYVARQKFAKVEQALEDQFSSGRLLASISSRPGQCGRADGYILEGKELEFYMRKIKSKKAK